MLKCMLPLLATAALATGDPPPASRPAETAPPAPAAIELAAGFHRETTGRALLIQHGDTLLLETYADGMSAETPHALHDATTAFWGVAAACAVADGILELSEPVSQTIATWADAPAKAGMTVRQLLTLANGLEPATELYDDRIDDKFRYALNVPVLRGAENRFRYGPASHYVFGDLLKRKLGESPVDYLKTRVLAGIGANVAGWTHDAYGQPDMAGGASLTARDWARFGVLVRDQGAYAGQQAVPADVLQPIYRGSRANPAYGLGFWINAPGALGDLAVLAESPRVRRKLRRRADAQQQLQICPAAPQDLLMAAGRGGQRLYLSPSRALVVVRFGDGPEFDDHAFLTRLFTGQPPEEGRRGRRDGRADADAADADGAQRLVAGCGLCIFGMPGVSECLLAVELDDRHYLVNGSGIDDHGDAHAADGLCNARRAAQAVGRLNGDRFEVEWLRLEAGVAGPD